MKEIVNIGVLGCGNISDIYLTNLTSMFHGIKVLGVCDINFEAAKVKTEKYNLPVLFHSYEEMLATEEIDVILNLCPPLLHYEMNKKALLAGKHIYSEKPLAVEYEQAKELVELAKASGLQIGCSPDTVLGASIQTCRKLIDSGMIGDVVGCSANLIKRGVETWHPNPNFLYQPGGGPLLDMGPYYIGTLMQLVGRVSAVQSVSSISFKERVITSQPHYGEVINVNVPTYVNALLEFSNGALGTMTLTFDVYKAHLPFIEIYGSNGTLSVPDPNCFGAGPILLYRPEQDNWLEMPQMFHYHENCRGLGLTEMCQSIREGRECRANGMAALHAVEIMAAIEKSAKCGKKIQLESDYFRPALMDNCML